MEESSIAPINDRINHRPWQFTKDNAVLMSQKAVEARARNRNAIKEHLKTHALEVLDRLYLIAMDKLIDDSGKHIRIKPELQEKAAIDYLDRALGKPQVAVDVTSQGRPIVFDSAFADPVIPNVTDSVIVGIEGDMESEDNGTVGPDDE